MIENVCGGLRSIIALTFFAALFAALCRAKGLWRWFLLLMAFPVAIACNVARITSLIIAAHHIGTDAAGEHGWFHDLSGILVFALALAFMFLLESAVLLLGKLLKRDWSDARPAWLPQQHHRPGRQNTRHTQPARTRHARRRGRA